MGTFPVMKLLGHTIRVCLTLLAIAKQFCKVVARITFPLPMYESSVCYSSMPTFSTVDLSNDSLQWYVIVVLIYIFPMTIILFFPILFSIYKNVKATLLSTFCLFIDIKEFFTH